MCKKISNTDGEFMALLSFHYFAHAARNIFMIAPHKHVADHWAF